MATDQVLENYISLVAAFTEFLTVAIHLILYERDVYPKESFARARKYNYPVMQNRHPLVCKWIDDAIVAIRIEMLKSTVQSTSLIILSPTQQPVERYVFDTSSFPIVNPKEIHTYFSYPNHPHTSSDLPDPANNINPPPPPPTAAHSNSKPKPIHTPLTNLHPQFTSVLARLSTLTSTLPPLPNHAPATPTSSAGGYDDDPYPSSSDDGEEGECSFTLAIEMRDRPAGKPPVGWPMPWVPAQVGVQGPELGVSEEIPPGAGGEVRHTSGNRSESLSGHGGGGGGVGNGSLSGGEGTVGNRRWSEGLGDGSNRNIVTGQEGQEREWGVYRGGPRTRTRGVRSVEAGPFVMEVWAEEVRDYVGVGEEAGPGFGSGFGGGRRKGKGKERDGYRGPSVEDFDEDLDLDLDLEGMEMEEDEREREVKMFGEGGVRGH